MRSFGFAPLAGAALTLVCVTSVQAAPASAPAVSIAFEDGTVTPLARYAGKVVLIDFWASWCAPCARSFPALDGLYREFHDQGLEVVAVNVDEDRRAAQAFLAKHPHVMPIGFDPKGSLPSAFHAEAMPASFLVDHSGVIRYSHAGFTDTTLDAYRREIHGLLLEAALQGTK